MNLLLSAAEQGSGFPLLLLHGNGEDHTYFEHQISYFSSGYRVVAPDTRGHGNTPRGTAPFSLEQFVLDLKKFLEQKQIVRAHFLGFSDGGNIALLFALRFPEYVESLILNGANLTPKGVKLSTQLPILFGWGCTRLLSPFSAQARKNYELLNLMVTQPHISPDCLRRLSMPVLVLAGDRDMIKDSHTRQIAASIPDSQLCILHGNHFVARQNPQDFNQAVGRFLKNL